MYVDLFSSINIHIHLNINININMSKNRFFNHLKVFDSIEVLEMFHSLIFFVFVFFWRCFVSCKFDIISICYMNIVSSRVFRKLNLKLNHFVRISNILEWWNSHQHNTWIDASIWLCFLEMNKKYSKYYIYIYSSCSCNYEIHFCDINKTS